VVVPKLSDKTYMSISLVAMVVGLSFWTGRLDTTVQKQGEENVRQDKEIAELKKSRDEADRLVAAQLSTIAQDVASIKGMLKVSQIFERDARPRR
jgi:hypothetical protein